MLCSLENLQLALDSHVAKGNLVRQLKQWRRNGSPTYEAAFGLGSLCVRSTSEQYGLRAKAGQSPKFKPSWLHKKLRRLKHFLLGRPILQAIPSMSTSSRQYVQAASSPSNGGECWHLLFVYVRCRKAAQRLAAATKKDARGSFWQGKKAMLRGYRRRWWLVRRRLKRRYSELMARTEKPSLSCKAAKWAIEENILQAGFRVQMSRQNHPQWRFLTETGSILYLQSLNQSLGLAQKQLATATCSVNNALGRPACEITLQGAQDLLTARGYEHDCCTFLRQGGRILSPLVVDCALEQIGFRLQHCHDPRVGQLEHRTFCRFAATGTLAMSAGSLSYPVMAESICWITSKTSLTPPSIGSKACNLGRHTQYSGLESDSFTNTDLAHLADNNRFILLLIQCT